MDEQAIPISRAEYEAKFGSSETPTPISRADFMAKFPSATNQPQETIETAIAGPIDSLVNGLTLGHAPQLYGGTAGLLRYLSGKIGFTPEESLADAYSAEKDATAKNLENYAQIHPWAKTGMEIAGAFKLPMPTFSKEPGLLNALGNVAKSAGVGAGYSAAYGLGAEDKTPEQEIADAIDRGQTGALFGGAIGAAGEGVAGLANVIKSRAGSMLESLLGYNPTLKQRYDTFVDAAGNKVDVAGKAITAENAVGKVTKKDIAVQQLKETGFTDSISYKDSPESVALKLSRFREKAGKDIAGVIDEAAKLEKETAPELMGQSVQPDWDSVYQFADEVGSTDASIGEKLRKQIDNIKAKWESSAQDVSTLQNTKSLFGNIKSKTFNRSAGREDTFFDLLNKKIYGTLADAVNGRISAIAKAAEKPEMVDQFSSALKRYSGSITFENSAWNAARKGGFQKAMGDLFGLSRSGLGTTAAAAAANFVNPALGGVLSAERLLTAAEAIKPVQAMKAEKAIGGLLEAGSKVPVTPSSAVAINKKKETKSDNKFLDNVMFRAERRLQKGENMPKVIPSDPDTLSAVVDSVITQESGGKAEAVSEVGAEGLMQIMPKTGRELAAKVGVSYNPKDPEQNKMLGTLYLKELLDKYGGDLELALTAYHSGMGRVDRLLAKTGGTTLDDILPHLGPVGQKYAKQVIGRMERKGTLLA